MAVVEHSEAAKKAARAELGMAADEPNGATGAVTLVEFLILADMYDRGAAEEQRTPPAAVRWNPRPDRARSRSLLGGNQPDRTREQLMAQKALTIDDYSLADLIEVAQAAKAQAWRIRQHPTRDHALTIYSRHGFVIHPNLGFVNDEQDAEFIATFDPAMVLSILERLAEAPVTNNQEQNK